MTAKLPLVQITVDGVAVTYVEEGSGEPIVLLHNATKWRHQIPHLAKTNRVIAIDWPRGGKAYDEEVARLGAILTALSIDKCNLFAHDYGGYLALGFAIAHPERVLRLAILDSRAHDIFPRSSYWAAHLTRILAPELGWLHYDLRPRTEQLAALAKLPIPTAIVWGKADPATPIRIARELAQTMPNATLTEIDRGYHSIMEHRPDEVREALTKLLAQQPASPVAPPTLPPPVPARDNATVREAIIYGWSWVVCVSLIALGAVGLFTDKIGPLPTNTAHALYLNLGVGGLGFALTRFEYDHIFLPIFSLGVIGLAIAGFVPATQTWLYETFHLTAFSSWSELAAGVASLAIYLAFRRRN